MAWQTEVLELSETFLVAEKSRQPSRTNWTKLGRAAQKTFVDNPAVLNLTAAEEQNAWASLLVGQYDIVHKQSWSDSSGG